MALSLGRVVTGVAAALRPDGFVRHGSDLLCCDESGGTVVISFQGVRGSGGSLRFYVHAAVGPAEYYQFLASDRPPTKHHPARGGAGMWWSRIAPTSPALAMQMFGTTIGDTWECRDEGDIEQAAADLVTELRDHVLGVLFGLLAATTAALAVQHRVSGFSLMMDAQLADALLALRHEPPKALRRRLLELENSKQPALLARFGPWFASEIGRLERHRSGTSEVAAPVNREGGVSSSPRDTTFIDTTDPDDDSVAGQPGARVSESAVVVDGEPAVPCMVLDLGRALMIQLPDDASSLLRGGLTMAEFAEHVGLGPIQMPPQRVFNGAVDRIWVQGRLQEAVLVARRSTRADDLAFISLGHLNAADDYAQSLEGDWLMLSLVHADAWLPTGRAGTLDALMVEMRVWGGSVATIS